MNLVKNALLLVAFALLFIVAVPLQAQSGCVNSPEAPTAVLALAGSAGAGLVIARTRFRARKSK